MGISRVLNLVATLKTMSEPRDIHRAVGDKGSEWFAMNTITERGIYTPATKDIPSVKLNLDEMTKSQPMIFIYDNYTGGIRFTPLLFDSHEELIENTYRLINSCACKDDCPSCVGPSKEVGKNSKQVAIEILVILNK
ncbi:MAG: DUF1998 domain-containing protein [Candidatus Marinimicrobia bacterium]|nr:DUF1998 domain-containing protein [Candidatus Neomarinimicrobiota bacterium]